MNNKTSIAVLLASLSAAALAAPGDYEPAYDQESGYGNVPLDERVAKLEKKLSGETQMEFLNRIEQLQSDVLRLRGEMEEMSHQLEVAKKQQREMYQDLDRRLQAAAAPPPPPPAAPSETPTDAAASTPAPAAPTPAPAPTAPITTPQTAPATPPAPAPQTTAPPPPAVKPPAAPPTPAPVAQAAKPAPVVPAKTTLPGDASPESAARQAAYQKGFNLLKDGKYSDAIKEFKSFLSAYPKGEYSDNAVYWLAEAHYVNRDLPAARDAFRKLVKEYPQATKIADAQLKLGYIDYDAGQWMSARETLSEVIKRYPDTSAAKLAQKRLDKMKQEGH
jgi:tol-pal system protein YbgF